MKRSRLIAALIAIPVVLLIGAWLYVWFRRGALFWGLGETAASAAAFTAALCGAAALLIKPIPVKSSAIAALYILLFSLLTEGIFSLAGLLSPFFLTLRNCALVPLALTAAGMSYAAIHGRKTVLTRYQITSDRVRSPIRIALVSDVHMGLSVDAKRLQMAADGLSAQNPDLFIIAGDLADDQTSPEEMQAACRILGRVRAARGTWFVYGNHDLAAVGPRLAFSPEQYRNALSENGIAILDDRTASLDNIATLAGRLDCWGETPRLGLRDLLRDADPALPIILVDHQPKDIREAAEAGVLLQLSGHTHGGQVWPMGALSALLQPRSVVYGHRCVDGCHVIVSSGLGTRGSRLRSGCTAETVLIDLLPAQSV